MKKLLILLAFAITLSSCVTAQTAQAPTRTQADTTNARLSRIIVKTSATPTGSATATKQDAQTNVLEDIKANSDLLSQQATYIKQDTTNARLSRVLSHTASADALLVDVRGNTGASSGGSIAYWLNDISNNTTKVSGLSVVDYTMYMNQKLGGNIQQPRNVYQFSAVFQNATLAGLMTDVRTFQNTAGANQTYTPYFFDWQYNGAIIGYEAVLMYSTYVQ